MSRIPSFLLQHEVVVEPYEGASANGPVYGPPVMVRCWLEEGTQMQRTADGSDRVPTGRYFARLDSADAPTGSRVTVPSGGRYSVTACTRHEGGGLPTPDHLEVSLEVTSR